MYYSKVVTATAGKTRATAEEATIIASAGILHHVHVFIPQGHAGKAHLTLSLGEQQIIPANPDGSIVGNAETIDFKEHIPMYRYRNRIKLKYWNTSDTHNHSFYVLVGVLAEEYLALEPNIKAMIDRLDKFLWRLGA